MTRRGIHLGYWGAIPVWLLAIFLHPLHVDGAEHAHVAWLQATQGLEPMRDFFQHHTPLLWDLLRVYYLLGGEGIGVVYFGRGLVVLAGVLTVAGFWQLARQLRRGPRTYPPGMLGVLFFIFTTVTLDALFVIRAESMGIPLLVWSLVLWSRPVQRRLSWDLLGGTLVGLAAFASPRFVLLGGMFLFLNPDPARLWVTDLRRYVVLATGALLAVAAYLFAKGMSVADFRFILEFSSLLQYLGEGSNFSRNLVFVVGVAGFVFWRLYQAGGAGHGRAWLLDLGHLLVVMVANLVVVGSYPYHHAFAPTALLIALLLIRAEERLENQGPLRDLYYGVVLVIWVYTISMRQYSLAGSANLMQGIQAKRAVLAAVPPGKSILALPPSHPIAMADASYYARPLTQESGRLCKVVAASPPEWQLPPCDYLADLKSRQPLLVTRRLKELVGPATTQEQLEAYVEEYYVQTPCYYVRADKDQGGSVVSALKNHRRCSPASR
ncbi:MAG: glycosyltransferase family 39 protein [Gammaproteobacteria bacterium]|nr:glycosyltransferase family 39 protein [Gammaproteobacteria bacterium]